MLWFHGQTLVSRHARPRGANIVCSRKASVLHESRHSHAQRMPPLVGPHLGLSFLRTAYLILRKTGSNKGSVQAYPAKGKCKAGDAQASSSHVDLSSVDDLLFIQAQLTVTRPVGVCSETDESGGA